MNEIINMVYGFINSSWGWATWFGLLLFGYAWTTKTDNVDTVAAAHINLLQTEKLDRDGAIPMTGALTTNGQIVFPAVQVPSAGVNTLDDYEENSWTTTVSGIVNFTGTPTLSNGKYTKIGRVIHLEGMFSGTVTTVNLLSYFAFTLPISPAYSTAGIAFQNGGVRIGVIDVTSVGGYLFFPPQSGIVAGADTFFFQVTYQV